MVILGFFYALFQALDVLTTKIALKVECEEVNSKIKKTITKNNGFPLYLIVLKISIGLFLMWSFSMVENRYHTYDIGMVKLVNCFYFLIVCLDLFLLIVVVNNFMQIIVSLRVVYDA